VDASSRTDRGRAHGPGPKLTARFLDMGGGDDKD